MDLSSRSRVLLLATATLLGLGCSVQNPDADSGPDPDGGAKLDGGDGGAAVDCPSCIVLTGARLFDGVTARPGTLVLRGETIDRVIWGPATVKAGKTVDLSGKTVLPGLMDLHVHTAASAGPSGYYSAELLHEPHLRATLRAGVTSYLDLGSSARRIFAYRGRIADGTLRGPNLLAAGPLTTPSGGHPCYKGQPASDSCALVDKPADVTTALAPLWPQQPDVLKVVLESGTASSPLPRLDLASLAALVAAAQAHQVPVVAHVSRAQDVKDALDQGVKVMAHLPAEDLIDAALAARLVKEQAVVIPTMAVYEGLYLLASGKLTLDQSALAADVPAGVLAALVDPSYVGGYPASFQAWTQGLWENAQANLKTCVKAGVTLAAGTDAGNPATFHGLALHRELELYVAAGLTPAQALDAATRQAARALGLTDRGELKAGQLADLLVVSGDPLTAIADTRKVAAVFSRGAQVDRAALKLGGSGSLIVTPVTGRAEGEVCLGASECGAGLVCDRWAARCTGSCNPQLGTGCKAGSACFSQSAGAAIQGYCMLGDGCDLFKQDCANGAACVWLGNGATSCWYASEGKQAGDACGPSSSCAVGLQCNGYQNTCYELCHPTSSATGPCSQASQSCYDLSSLAGLTVGQCT